MIAACRAAGIAAFASACFHPIYDRPTCPTGECPDGLTCIAGRCEDPARIDAAGPPDAALCFGSFVPICISSPPTMPLSIASPITISTDAIPCTPIVSGGDYCVLAATTILVEAGLRASGSRPLVLLASESIAIGTAGVIDVGSHRGAIPELGAGAEPAACSGGGATQPDMANMTHGGGAGGSFIGAGGNGGNGGRGGTGGVAGSAAAANSVTQIRGGCAGQNGAGSSAGTGGHGGGAVYLIAGTRIDVMGTINAAGESGGGATPVDMGGGGGGAGGMIAFDAPLVTATGLILANGGGGGEASGNNIGQPGADPSVTAAALGGSGGTASGGDGGNGSSAPTGGAGVSGLPGSSQQGGGGGGGGGAGLVKGPPSLGPNVSPAPVP